MQRHLFRQMAGSSGVQRATKILSRGFTALVALLCMASVAYAIHANREAVKADGAALRARQWERDARATLAHRTKTGRSLRLLVHQYNSLARSATTEQRHLLAALARARRRAQAEHPSASPPVEYATQSIQVALPAPAVSAAPATASAPTTKTS